MNFFLLAVFAFLPFALADLSCKNMYLTSGSSCASPEDALQIDTLTFSPQPEKGKPFTVHFEGKLKERMAHGTTAHLTVKWGILPIRIPPVDVCAEIDKIPEAKMKCPVEAGDFNMDQTITLPDNIPKGSYKVHIQVKNQNERQLTCVNVELKI